MIPITVRSDAGTTDIRADGSVPLATVLGSVGATALAGSVVITLDGRPVDPTRSLTELGALDGAVVSAAHLAHDRRAWAGAGPVVVQTGGLGAGSRVRLGPAAVTVVGRATDVGVTLDDPTVSPRHLRITTGPDGTVVEDLGSHNGTRVDGVPVRSATPVTDRSLLALGAAEVVVDTQTAVDRHIAAHARRTGAHLDGRVMFNRPPRNLPPPPGGPVAVPDAPTSTPPATTASLLGLLGPLVVGLVMVQVMGDIRYGLFALLSPVMFITNLVAAKRRDHKSSRAQRRAFGEALETFEVSLSAAVTAERARLERRLPHPAEIVRRACLPSTRLWERRPHDDDYLELRLGRGPLCWEPPVDTARAQAAPELSAAVDDARVIDRCPLPVTLGRGGVVGVVGPRPAALSLARSLVCQAAVLHGPADLQLALVVEQRHMPDWDWCKWLPHLSAGPSGTPAMAASDDALGSLIETWSARPAETPVFIVVDVAAPTEAWSSLRALLSGEVGAVAAVVMSDRHDRLPSVCDTVVHLLDDLGAATVQRPGQGVAISPVVVAGMAPWAVELVGRRLARYADPELGAGSGLPGHVGLVALLGSGPPTAELVAGAWDASTDRTDLILPLGLGPGGVPVDIDLVADGPHMLIGGTTGSGKSEVLRSFVASAAAGRSPEAVVFMLVDYKGGAAFDCCAALPHVVGLVTDLDGHLAERAMLSLDAELRRRERHLRAAGVAGHVEYLRAGSPSGPLPRLVIVVDEFATLVAEVPEFMRALVDVAQRGRSLGVHLVLATQRPSGVVTADIRANTGIRLALRQLDPGDSIDLVGIPDAAAISRHTPGRAVVRLGPGAANPVQTALASRPSGARAIAVAEPFVLGAVAPRSPAPAGPTDLQAVVEACVDAAVAVGLAPPRRPWLPMLPAEIELSALLGRRPRPGVLLGVGDDPANQAQCRVCWEPDGGNLGLFGKLGSGTTSALITAAVAAVVGRTVAEVHLYAMDHGGGALFELASLPHVGAVLGPDDRERQELLIEHLATELDRRQAIGARHRSDEPRIILVVDDLPSVLGALDPLTDGALRDELERLVIHGAAHGISAVVTARRAGDLPSRMVPALSRQLLFAHVDASDFAAIGVRPGDVPALVPGRAIDSATRLVTQVAIVRDPAALVSKIVADAPGAPLGPRPCEIAALPRLVDSSEVSAAAAGDALELIVGRAAGQTGPASLTLEPGDQLMVCGGAGSGVTSGLLLLAGLIRSARPDAVMVWAGAAAPAWDEPPIPFDAVGALSDLQTVFELAAHDRGRDWIVLVDDAHRTDEPGRLTDLLGARHCRLLVGGRADVLHRSFGHWARQAARGGKGLLLAPRLDTDGDLLGVRLPRRVAAPMVPGRGFLVCAGDRRLVQLARPVVLPAA